MRKNYKMNFIVSNKKRKKKLNVRKELLNQGLKEKRDGRIFKPNPTEKGKIPPLRRKVSKRRKNQRKLLKKRRRRMNLMIRPRKRNLITASCQL